MKIIQRHSKKLILVLVLLILFNFCCPMAVKARGFLGIDIPGDVAGLFYWIERGVFALLNTIFCDDDDEHKYIYKVEDTGDDVNITVQMLVTPEAIIKGKFLLFNANIFENPDDATDDYYDDAEEKGIVNGKKNLRNIVAGWYYALRNFTIVALLSVLVYVGIRMIISTVAQDKAKYKIMFKDWLVALCLVIMMHYIMIATLNMTSLVVKAIGTTGNADSQTEKVMVLIQNIISDKDEGKGRDELSELEKAETRYYDEENDKVYTIGDAFALEFLLAAILVYTIIFAVKYMKREFIIIFLILLGPISCITYPIDKIGDGKAQAFNKWLTEFVYNVLIQPFHLLIYIVLVGTAVELADSNMLYSIVCFAVMIPAEKFIKEMFGFRDKLGSPLGAMTTGAMAGQLLNRIRGGGSSGGNNESKPKIPTKNDANNTIKENKLKPGLPGSKNSEGNGTGKSQDGSQRENPQQAMQDSYDEGYNSLDSNLDPQERDAYERENNQIEGMNYSPEEYEQILREPNPDATDEEIAGMMAEEQVETPDRVEESLEAARQQEDMARLENAIDRTADQNQEEQTENNNRTGGNDTANNQGIYSPSKQDKKSRFMNAARGIREHRDKVLMSKYGTKNRGVALGKYAGRKAGKMVTGAGKKAIRGATTLAGAAALGTFGFMFGQGSKAAMTGAAWGEGKGNKINKRLANEWANAKEYGSVAKNAFKNDNEETKRKNAVKELMKSPEQIDRASQSFSKRNDGRIASTRELNQELANRAKFKEMKLSDDQIDDAVQIYEDNKDSLGEEEATQLAYASASLASRYSAKEFEDEKKMTNAYQSLMKQYDALGVNKDLADENVRMIMQNAAGTYGIKTPALPTPTRKEEYLTNQQNIDKANASYAARHNGTIPMKAQLTQELEMGYNLRKAGVSEADRETFFNSYLQNENARTEARETLGEGATETQIDMELERRFEIKAKLGIKEYNSKYNEQQLTRYIGEAETFLREDKNITKPTNGQVYSEVRERLTVQDAYHVTEGSKEEIAQKVTAIRKSENQFLNNSSDKNGAKAVIEAQRLEARRLPEESSKGLISQAEYQRRFLAKYSKAEMQNSKTMEKAKKSIMKRLEKEGNVSTEYREAFADEVINKGKSYVGITDGNVD